MPTISPTPQRRDTLRHYRLQVRDAADVVVPFSGSEPLSARISATSDSPVLANPLTTWYDAAAGLLEVVVAPVDLEAMLPATYAIAINVNGGPQDAFTGTIVIGGAPTPIAANAVADAIYADIAARLVALDLFQSVILDEMTDDIGDLPVALIEDLDQPEWTPLAVGVEKHLSRFLITLYLGEQGQAAAMRSLEQAVWDALWHRSLAGITVPAWTRMQPWRRTQHGKHPQLVDSGFRMSLSEGEFAYTVRPGETAGGGGGGPTVPVPEPTAVSGFGTTGFGTSGFGS